MTNLQRFLKNVFSIGTADILSRFITAGVVLYLIRLLTPDEFGVLNFAQALLAYLIIITNLGLDSVATREVAREPDNYKKVMSTVMIIKTFQALISFTALVLFLLIINKPLLSKTMALMYGFIVFSYVLNIEWFFQGIEKMEYIAISKLLTSVLYVAGIIVIVKSSQQMIYIPVMFTCATFIGVFTILAIFIKQYGSLKFEIDAILLKSFFKQSCILGATFFLLQLLYSFDIILLSFYRTESEVGYYAAAYKLILFIIIPVAVFFQAMFPIISRLYKENKEKLVVVIRQINKLIPAISFPIVVLSFFAAGPLLNLLFGSRYVNSIPVFQLLIFSIFIIYSNSLNTHGLIASNNEISSFWSIFIAASSNIVLNFIFIPKFGMTGAACTTLFSEFAGAIYAYWAFKRYVVKESIFPWLWKPALASGVVIVYFLNIPSTIHIIYRVIGGILIYIFFLQIQGFLTGNEIETLRNVHPWLRKRN